MKGLYMKKLPKFKNEDEEREFWAEHDSTEHIDWSKAQKVSFPNLKPTLKTISIRLPESLIEEYKVMGNKEDVPYQALMKIVLSEGIKEKKNPAKVSA